MNLQNRIVKLEVKLKYTEYLLYANMVVIVGHIGFEIVPLIWVVLT